MEQSPGKKRSFFSFSFFVKDTTDPEMYKQFDLKCVCEYPSSEEKKKLLLSQMKKLLYPQSICENHTVVVMPMTGLDMLENFELSF